MRGEMRGTVGRVPLRERGEYGTCGRATRPPATGAGHGLGRSLPSVVVTRDQVCRIAETPGWPSVLSVRELAAVEAFAVEKRRRDWLAGRLAAKLLIARTLASTLGAAVPLRDIEVEYDADGAPRFTVARRPGLERGWSISITHASGHGACAMAQTSRVGRVGVDLERTRELRPELLRYFLSAGERRRLGESDPAGPITPLALWTIKEAVIKAAPRLTERAMRNVHLAWDETGRVAAAIAGPAANGVGVTVWCERRGTWILAHATCRPTGEA
jgi:4'-phosphopantetheinyl transferase